MENEQDLAPVADEAPVASPRVESRPERPRSDAPRSDGPRSDGPRGGGGDQRDRGGPGGQRGGPRRPGGGGGFGGMRGRGRRMSFPKDPTLVNYKNTDLLQRFLNEAGQIKPRRKTGASAKQQRMLSRAIKRARHLALLPFTGTQSRG